jgi:hypothetical protein
MRKETRGIIAATLVAVALAVCGGLSDDRSPQLFAMGGDATNYRGHWRSECGSFLDGLTPQGVGFELDITATAGNVATGCLISPTACANGGSPTSTSAIVDVTLTIDAAAACVDARQTAWTSRSLDSAAPRASFGFLSDRNGIHLSSNTTFSSMRLRRS